MTSVEWTNNDTKQYFLKTWGVTDTLYGVWFNGKKQEEEEKWEEVAPLSTAWNGLLEAP